MIWGALKEDRMPTTSIRPPSKSPLPYGQGDLAPAVRHDKGTGRVGCVVSGCKQWLRPPTRSVPRGEVCPEHGIRVHRGGTFSYEDYRRNLTVDDADYFHRHIRGHPFKWETHRFGSENSEDALTFNVFRSLQRAGLLHKIAQLCTGSNIAQEPRLLLWGLEQKADGVEPWDLLIRARERFESDLPEGRPKTEPDITLFLPGKYLVLIEAKFTSPNGVYQKDRKTKLFDLTLDQLINIYQDKKLKILDYDVARKRERIHYQLWRNMTFAEWLAAADRSSTLAYHVNLVRRGFEEGVAEEFLTLIRPEFHDRFEQITWENIYSVVRRPSLDRLGQYMEQKTASLRPAFKIPDQQS
jgi:hypothetical protein